MAHGDRINAREEMLGRVRAAVRGAGRDSRAAGGGSDPDTIVRAYQRDDKPGDPSYLAERFADRLRDYRAHVHRCPVSAIAETVRAIAETACVTRLVVPTGLPVDWIPPTVTPLRDEPGGDDGGDDGRLGVDEIASADGVLTAAAAAIAETGTIVLDGSPDQGRRVITLVPDLHICVVHTDQIVKTVPQAVARLSPTRPSTWISGPSATSDIELNRVEGVHGPRTLHVIITTD